MKPFDKKKTNIHKKVRNASGEERDRRNACFVLDELRQDYQRESDRAESEHKKKVRELRERKLQK